MARFNEELNIDELVDRTVAAIEITARAPTRNPPVPHDDVHYMKEGLKYFHANLSLLKDPDARIEHARNYVKHHCLKNFFCHHFVPDSFRNYQQVLKEYIITQGLRI